MMVPTELPTEQVRKTSRACRIRFLYQAETWVASSARPSKSRTFGLWSVASTRPLTIPTPMVGFRLVKGLARVGGLHEVLADEKAAEAGGA